MQPLSALFHLVASWLALPIGMVLCTIVGVITGPFAFRLEGLYLAIVTIILFFVQHLLRNGLDIYYGKDYLRPIQFSLSKLGATYLVT